MNSREFRAMGTEWCIESDAPALLAEAESLVHVAEARLSRFLDDSSLSKLNRERSLECLFLAEVVREALELSELTQGAFDVTQGARLAQLGYDRTFEEVGAVDPAPAPQIEPARADRGVQVRVDSGRVTLVGEGWLDLGGVAKGWTIDRVHNWLLANGATEVLVDGGGDIRATGGGCPIGVGEGLVVELSGDAVATTSRRRRQWSVTDGSKLHHILDPRTGWPSMSPVDTVTVVAADATTADGLATAVLVDPVRLIEQLPALGARAAVRDTQGHWWTTPNWEHLQ